MDFSLASLSPEERAAMQANIVQNQRVTDLLRAAGQRANRHNNLAAIAQMAGNQGISKAALLAQKNAQMEASPVQMGQQGFMLPDQGEFVESPMFAENKRADREAKQQMLEAQLASRAEQARMLEEGRNERAGQSNELRKLLAAQAEQGRQDRLSQTLALRELLGGKKGAVDEIKLGRTRDASVQKYTSALEKAALPEFDQALTIAEQVLSGAKEGELPGYGRIMSAVPSSMLPEAAQLARTDMQMAANILLKSRSGAAVTDSEMRRFLQEVATGAGMSEKALRKGWQNVRAAFDAKRQNLTTLLDDEGHAAYMERGGKDYRIKQAAPTMPSLNLPPGFKVIGRAD